LTVDKNSRLLKMTAPTGKTEDASTPVYEIYALKYAGPLTGKLAMFLWMEGWNEEVERNYYIWAIKGKDGIMVVDTGLPAASARQEDLSGFIDPLSLLSLIGADRHNVTKIILSHLHFDHGGGVDAFSKAFPQAFFYVQQREFEFWLNHPLATRPVFAWLSDPAANAALTALQGQRRVVLVNGDRIIEPGIEVLLTPGHTPGLQSVAVNTGRGEAIIASDCGHLWRNFKDDRPTAFITDMISWLESYDKIRSRTTIDLIFPGHDTALSRQYPEVAENVTRLV
jgi:glyoxylase-like metal-dependent hydrolase (beta-lactamase superfamily II)